MISYQRADNYFVQDPETKVWMLIDGPWFKELEKYHSGPMPIRICKPQRISFVPMKEFDLSAMIAITTTWYPIKWHPGNPKWVIAKYPNSWEKTRRWNANRTRIGYKMADGHLPLDFYDTDLKEIMEG